MTRERLTWNRKNPEKTDEKRAARRVAYCSCSQLNAFQCAKSSSNDVRLKSSEDVVDVIGCMDVKVDRL